MKKEKQVRSYKRRTKSGKVVTVKAHTAKYDAAEKAKEVAKEKGAGKELEAKRNKMPNPNLPMNEYLDEWKKRQQAIREEVTEEDSTKKSSEKKEKEKKVRPVGSGTNGPTPKKKSKAGDTKVTASKTSEPAFTAAEFKEWYRGTGSAADKKVAKALRAQLGRAGYRKLEDEAIDNYSSRGHLSMFKRVSGGSEVSAKTGKSTNKANGESKKSGVKEKATEAKGSKGKSKVVSSYKDTPKGGLDLSDSEHSMSADFWKIQQSEGDKAAGRYLRKNKLTRSDIYSLDAVKDALDSEKDTSIKKKYGDLIRSKKEAMDKAKKERYMEKHRKAYENYVYEPPKATKSAGTTGAGADWSKATVDKIGREYGGGYTIVGTPNDGLWSSTNFRTKSQALDFIKRKQKEASAEAKHPNVSLGDVKKAYSIPGGYADLGLKRISSEGWYDTYQHKSGKLFRVYRPSGDTQDITPTRKGKRKSEETTIPKNGKGAKKPLTSLQNHAINSLLNQPGWTMSKAEKYVRTLSAKEVQRLAHKDM